MQSIYEEFRCELGLHKKDILSAQSLHKDLLDKNPFKYESPFLISAVCVYAVSHNVPQKVTLQDIEEISHIKKEDIVKCYELALDSELEGFIHLKEDDYAN